MRSRPRSRAFRSSEDETAGIQVYIAGAGGSLDVPIGAYVRVEGKIELYRGGIELIPASMELVEIVNGPEDNPEWPPTAISVGEAANDKEALPGKLVEIEGKIARIEEFSYSYEVDVVNDEGQLVNLYVDKNTGISIIK